VGDSVGPGGISGRCAAFPVMVEIARAVERHAPDALLLNVSNPMVLAVPGRDLSDRTQRRWAVQRDGGSPVLDELVFDAPMHKIDPVVAGCQPPAPW